MLNKFCHYDVQMITLQHYECVCVCVCIGAAMNQVWITEDKDLGVTKNLRVLPCWYSTLPHQCHHVCVRVWDTDLSWPARDTQHHWTVQDPWFLVPAEPCRDTPLKRNDIGSATTNKHSQRPIGIITQARTRVACCLRSCDQYNRTSRCVWTISCDHPNSSYTRSCDTIAHQAVYGQYHVTTPTPATLDHVINTIAHHAVHGQHPNSS